MSVSSKQATGTLHRHLNLFPDLFRTSTSTEEATAPFVRIGVPHDGYSALYCGSANHSRTSSSSSLPYLVGSNSSSGESFDDELPELESIEDGRQLVLRHFASRGHDLDLGPAARAQRAFEHSSSGESSDDDSELPQLECIERTAVECRQCRPFPASHGCRPCRFSWPDLDLRPAARKQHDLCVRILSNDYCPLVAGGARDFVMYCGARCYNQRRRADTGYDVLDYVKSLKRFKTKPSLNISVEEYLRYCHTNMSVYVQVD